jgi:hypothetical protein
MLVNLNKNKILIIAGVFVFVVSVYLAYHFSQKGLFSISVLFVIAGVIFESKKITESWSIVLKNTSISYILSFLAFLPFKGENNYVIDDHIKIFPYFFVVNYAISIILSYERKIITRITEGITFIQSIAIIYWVLDYGFINVNSFLLKLFLIIGLIFSFYSFYHAFTYKVLKPTSRLLLSIWSSIIMMLFAIDFIYRVYQNEQIENSNNIIQAIYIVLQFFILRQFGIKFLMQQGVYSSFLLLVYCQ